MIFRIKKKHEVGFKLWLENWVMPKMNLRMAARHLAAKAHARH